MQVKLIKRGSPIMSLKNGDNPKVRIFRTYSHAVNIIQRWEGILIEEITYRELVAQQQEHALAAGRWYQITDYVTTALSHNGIECDSAEHPFDLIVQAWDNATLNETAYAIQHDGDSYFSNSNLSAWELKYDIHNDYTKYGWADSVKGKGVIYYMKDEFGNECPYDFKNIRYVRYTTTDGGFNGNYAYMDDVDMMAPYGSTVDSSDNHTVYTFNAATADATLLGDARGNKIAPYTDDNGAQCLNNIVFLVSPSIGATLDNEIKEGGANCTFGFAASCNEIGYSFYGNFAAIFFERNRVYSNVMDNSFGVEFRENVVESEVTANSFSSSYGMSHITVQSGLTATNITIPQLTGVVPYSLHKGASGQAELRAICTFEGATANSSSIGGLVPIATTSDVDKYLKGDGSWAPVEQDNTYVFEQGIAAATWTIAHNLDKHPSVTIVDSSDNIIEGDVVYVDNNNITITFTVALTGKAYLN